MEDEDVTHLVTREGGVMGEVGLLICQVGTGPCFVKRKTCLVCVRLGCENTGSEEETKECE